MDYETIVGADPGMSGGVAKVSALGGGHTHYTPNWKAVEAYPMPLHEVDGKPLTTKEASREWATTLDFHCLYTMFRGWQAEACGSIKVVLERAQAMPDQGVSGVFSYGANYGGLAAILQALCIEYDLVRPMKWKTALFGKGNTSGKERSVEFAEELIGRKLLASTRCRKSHDGMTDAVCLAYYGTSRR